MKGNIVAYATKRKREVKAKIVEQKLDKPLKELVTTFSNVNDDEEPYYKTFKIPKRNGKVRVINAPSLELKKASRKLLKIMDKVINRHPCDIGFCPNKGYTDIAVECLKENTVEKSITISIDLKDFFPSITQNDTAETLVKELALSYKEAKIIAAKICKDGKLVQGNPVSPIIASLAIRSIDNEILNYARERNGTYRRYADDITIVIPHDQYWKNTPIEVRKNKASEIGGLVNRLNSKCNVRVNRAKVHVRYPRLPKSSTEFVGLKAGPKAQLKSTRACLRSMRFWKFQQEHGYGYDKPKGFRNR